MAPHGAASDAHPPVARVFVFDDRLGRGEGAEHEKLLGVFPSSTARDECAAAVGLAQGLTGFLAPFADARLETPRRARSVASSSSLPPSAEPSPRRSLVLAADARRVACLECEPHIWWLLSVDARAAPERDVRDHALLRMLADAHEDYELMHGSVQSALSVGTKSHVYTGDGEKKNSSLCVHLARRRLAPFVASLGWSLESDSDLGGTSFETDARKGTKKKRETSPNALTHARDYEPVALANHADPSAFVHSPRGESERDAASEKRNQDESPRRVASRVLDAVASALRRRGASVAASAAVYRAADGLCRAASASSRAIARFANRRGASFFLGPEANCETGSELDKARDDARRIDAEAASALAALRAFPEATATAALGADDSSESETSRGARVVSDEDQKTFFFAFADAAAGRGVATVRVADPITGDAVTFAWTLSFDHPENDGDETRSLSCDEILTEISKSLISTDEDATTDSVIPSSFSPLTAPSLFSFRDAFEAERKAMTHAIETGAFQPHAFVLDDELRTVGSVARFYPVDEKNKNFSPKKLSSATLRAASATRAELDAFRRERDEDAFPNESCHRASHDAWVAVRGAAFFTKEKEESLLPEETPLGESFVVSVAEESGATLLEASARADACVRQAEYF